MRITWIDEFINHCIGLDAIESLVRTRVDVAGCGDNVGQTARTVNDRQTPTKSFKKTQRDDVNRTSGSTCSR